VGFNVHLFSAAAVFAACVLFTLATLPLLGVWQWFWVWPLTFVAGILSLLGCYDLRQRSHAVLRNYPIIGHIRYRIEAIRPEIRQYLLEGDNEKLPFSRSQRSLVYARAKNEVSDRPFGTLMDVYGTGFEFISHSLRPAPHADPTNFRIKIGGPQCTNPYSTSVLNISAMSFGSLSGNAIEALNRGAKARQLRHDTAKAVSAPITASTAAI
jgi:glutamate synthase domain-containing protein 2